MKKILFPIALATAMLSLNSCSSNDDDAASASEYISLTTAIKQNRLVTDEEGVQSFAENDKISVYAWTGSKDAPAKGNDRVVDNSINQLTGSKWVSTPQMRWKNPLDTHYFVGVYPSNETSITDLTAVDYTLDATDQEKSDLLVATNLTGLKASDNPVALEFDHMMAKFVLNLTYKKEFKEIPTVKSATFNDVVLTAKVNYVTKNVTPDTEVDDLALPAVKANEQYATVFIPQTGAKQVTVEVETNYGVKSYTFTHTEDFKFQSGKTTVLNLVVGSDGISFKGISVNDWNKGDEIPGGEAEK